MTQNPAPDNNKTEPTGTPPSMSVLYTSARGVAIVAGVFSLIVCVVIMYNGFSMRAIDMFESDEISELRTRLQKKSGDKKNIQASIRDHDLKLRQKFFQGRRVLRVGAYLLIGGIALMLAAWKTAISLRPELPHPTGAVDEFPSGEPTPVTRWLLSGTGAVLLIATITLALTLSGSLPGDSVVDNGDEPAGAAMSGKSIDFTPATREDILNNWANFRGPDGNGISVNATPPTQWDGSEMKNILWKHPITEPGYSSPVVWKGKLFYTTGDETARKVYCLDANDGKELWVYDVKNIPGSPKELPPVTEDTGYAAPTMATNGTLVYAIFATGNIVCLDFDGVLVWHRNLGNPKNPYGYPSSPIPYDNKLIVQYINDDAKKILALEAATGKILWEKVLTANNSWASPIVVHTGSRTEIIISTNPLTVSYDPETGKKLWSVDGMEGEVGPSPAYEDGMVFSGTQYSSVLGINVSTGEKVWETFDGIPPVSSLLAHNGLLIMASDDGLLTCLDTKTGDMVWEQEFNDGFYSSPILAGENFYLIDMLGMTHIIRMSREYSLIASVPLGESVVSTPAFVGDRIYIRGSKHMYCIGTKE